MGLLHLGLLVASILGVGIVDARWRLFLWAAPKRAVLVLLTGAGFLLLWDIVGIAAGIFTREPNPISTGILLAPHLPIEEPVFLLFLLQVTMVLYTGARRILRPGAERHP